MNKQIGRKRYSIEFKLEAVRLANESGRTKTQIARELDVRLTRFCGVLNLPS